MGSNIELSATALRATLRWTPGPGVPSVDTSALLLDERGLVGAEADFVFYNQPRHPSGAVVLADEQPGADAVDVDLTLVAPTTTRIVLAASSDGGTFGQVPGLRLELTDRNGGGGIASFAMQAADETAFVAAEIYRRAGSWKFRAIGQGYSSGLAGLATDFGIDVTSGGGDAPAAAPPAPPAAAPPAAAPPAPPAAAPPAAAPPAPPAAAPPPPPPAGAAPVPAPAGAAPVPAPAGTAPPPAGTAPVAPPTERDPGYDPLLDLG